jgi:Domain of unknown function (DUF4384)
MRLSVMSLGLVCLCVVGIGIAAAPMQDQDDVRGAFLTTRPKEKSQTSTATTRPSRRSPKKSVTPNKPPVKDPNGGHSGSATPSGSPAPSGSAKPVNAQRLGLGLTLFMRDSNGLAIRVDPDHVFRKGDRVRVLLETNTDGYLYIFNTTDDGAPVMIYPNADLDEAGNYMQAHVPFEIPSSDASEERLRWFAFDENAGTERLFFVFSREPLNGVPIEDDLIALCREAQGRCPAKPNTEVWAAVQKQMQEPLKTDKTARYGRAQTQTEQQASTRGLGLAKNDPEPSMVLMASSTRPTLVATLDLIHK